MQRRDVVSLIDGRRAYLHRRATMPTRGAVGRMAAIARDLVTGDYLRYGAFPKRDLLTDVRGR